MIDVAMLVQRFGKEALPFDDVGNLDHACINLAIHDAKAIASEYLGVEALQDSSQDLGVDASNAWLVMSLCDLAYYRMHDRIGAGKEAHNRYLRAIDRLKTKSKITPSESTFSVQHTHKGI